ncbi:MAG TPA: HEAT repeat domain-containing protein [Bryobacteraceae bacterium]|nr:HEAT repeat domain-containing protein [Bryobacteraceae bacterium]
MILTILFLVFSVSAEAQGAPVPFTQSFQSQQSGGSERTGRSGAVVRGSDHEDPDYQKGLRALDARQWDEAVDDFDASASHKGANTDAALYWKAYAMNRAGRREDALATISELKEAYPSSRWIKDAKALELEVRAATGAPVNAGTYSDDDLKLLALNSLMQSDPQKALPILQKLLASNNSDKIKDRAMFVLSQNPSPEARKLLADTARNSSNPDLQLKAIRYMGMMGNEETRKELASVYASTSDERVKRAILQSFMMSGSRDLLLNAAKTEKDPALRKEAIRQLAISGGGEQLWQLYQSESSNDNKQAILKSMFLTGDSSRLIEIARSDKDPQLRIAAIKSLGLMGDKGRGDVLVGIYRSDQNREVRDAVVRSLFLQQNAKALIDLARAEKDPEMKREIVSKLALIYSKDATDYMMELLK